MTTITMIACCYVGASGPEAALILVCAAMLGIHEENARNDLLGPLTPNKANPFLP